jgi:exodeoxyribonuclease VIII
MNDVMVDLETLDSVPGGVIVSIGAIFFNELGEMGRHFYQVVNVGSCIRAGLTTSDDTVDWWGRQASEVQQTLSDAYRTSKSAILPVALQLFDDWLGDASDLKIWGNGSDFDNAFLIKAYQSVGRTPPWKFYNNRCYRTLKNLPGVREAVPAPKRTGVHHNALSDAEFQAEHASAILFHLGPKTVKFNDPRDKQVLDEAYRRRAAGEPPLTKAQVTHQEPFPFPTSDQAAAALANVQATEDAALVDRSEGLTSFNPLNAASNVQSGARQKAWPSCPICGSAMGTVAEGLICPNKHG